MDTWEAYRDVARLGRKTRLPEAQRAILWSLFEQVRAGLASRHMITRSAMFTKLATAITEGRNPPFDFAVVDEAQDIGVAHLRFFAGLGRHRPEALFFAGDLGQRIFQQPFSWLALGVDIRGRSKSLRVNYRTSHQIRAQADRLLGPEVSDADGNREERRHTVSVFNGPAPEIRVLSSQEEEVEHVGQWISGRVKDGVAPHECGVFVRSRLVKILERPAGQQFAPFQRPPTALGPVANTDTKLLIYGLFLKGRVLAQDGVVPQHN